MAETGPLKMRNFDFVLDHNLSNDLLVVVEKVKMAQNISLRLCLDLGVHYT
jgi:hypothetical protein